MVGFPPTPEVTLKGQCFMSDWTALSVNFLPIRRFASKTVLKAFMATWFFAASPMRRSVSLKATSARGVAVRSERPQNLKKNHPRRREMATS